MGASGSVASILIPTLLDAGFTVSAIIRPSSNAVFDPKVTVHRANYDDFSALVTAFSGQDAVVSTVATFSADIQTTAIKAAAAAKVKRFIPSEYGGDTSRPEKVDFAVFPTKKRRIVQQLQALEGEGLTWTAICTGAFIDWLLELENAAMGWDLAARKVTIFDAGDSQFDVSTLDRVVQSIVSTLQHFEETKNTYVYVRSFTLTQNMLLEKLEHLSGKRFDITRASTAEIAARGAEHLRQGDLDNGYPEIVTAVGYGPWGWLDFKDRAVHWNRILQLPEENLEDTLLAVLKRKGLI
ncbi:hypothetical protein Plec18167_008950 [Paecilomyces lecythidis]|uniref:NAD(P)-binding domain-containing protein n=1 Tax=Paecilomyces lecythidis TaxID=3004212 RepID=A0ABR3WSG7_9EURO